MLNIISFLMIIAPIFLYQAFGYQIFAISAVGGLIGVFLALRESVNKQWSVIKLILALLGLFLVIAVPFVFRVSGPILKISLISGIVILSFLSYNSWNHQLTGKDAGLDLFIEEKGVFSKFWRR